MWTLLLLGAALAQQSPEVPDIDAQMYRPPVDARQTMWADDAHIFDGLVARASLGYMRNPVRFLFEDDTSQRIVTDAANFDVTAAYGFGRIRLGAHMPVYVLTTSQVADAETAGLGDLAFDLKGIAYEGPINVALGMRISVPTATIGLPLAEDGVAIELQAIFDQEFGDGALWAANLGYRVRPSVPIGDVDTGDQLVLRAGVGVPVTDTAGVSFDVASEGGRGTGIAAEVMAGGWVRLGDDGVARLGIGRGFTRGVGSSGFRSVLTLSWGERAEGAPDRAMVRDRDDDGIVDALDACRNEPEDMDGVEDEDGCPEAAVPVTVRFVTADGLPLTGVGVRVDGVSMGTSDAELMVPVEPGPFVLEAELSGYDLVRTTYEVKPDKPLDITETMYGKDATGGFTLVVRDANGRPITSPVWMKIDGGPEHPVLGDVEYRTVAGPHSLDVYADQYRRGTFAVEIVAGEVTELDLDLAVAKVVISEDEIVVIEHKVYFETDSDIIRPVSFELLQEVADVILDQPALRRIRIEGHTDGRGTAEHNMDLSRRRAAAVRAWLVDAGVEPERLEAVGYGFNRPIVEGTGEEVWEKNRRVEFVIVEADDR